MKIINKKDIVSSLILILTIAIFPIFSIFAMPKQLNNTVFVSIYDDFSDEYIVKNTKIPISEGFSLELIMNKLVEGNLLKDFTILNNKLATVISQKNKKFQISQNDNQITFFLKKNSILIEQDEAFLTAKEGDIFEFIYSPVSLDKNPSNSFSSIPASSNSKTIKNNWTPELSDDLNSACEFLTKNKYEGFYGDSYLIAMGIAGKPADIKAINSLQSSFKSKTFMETKYNISQTILASTFSGFDASIIEHGELVGHLSAMENSPDDDIYTHIFTLLAYDSNDYKLHEKAVNSRANVIKNILKFQKANGGFSQKENEEPNFEATAFAITALSTYKNIVAFAKPLEDAVNFLSTVQMKNGSFGKYENSESLCSAIIALNSMEIDLSDKRFNKGKLSLIEHLNSYKLKDGSYSDIKGGKSSLNSTRLAVIALSSIKKSDNPYILREPIENSKPQQTKVASSFHYIRDNSFKIMVGALTLIVIAIAVIIVSHKITKRKKTE